MCVWTCIHVCVCVTITHNLLTEGTVSCVGVSGLIHYWLHAKTWSNGECTETPASALGNNTER